MTHELKRILEAFTKAQRDGQKSVLATVVELEGSSYRRPGVRMLVLEKGDMVGAVSGGCVEKEIQKQASEVIETGKSKMMTYDGRYRLGCEGIIYILLELFEPDNSCIPILKSRINKRLPFEITSYYTRDLNHTSGIGSMINIDDQLFHISTKSVSSKEQTGLSIFSQTMPPCFRLLIVGAEHDAVQLCLIASLMGWDVDVISSHEDPKSTDHFPGSRQVLAQSASELDPNQVDENCAVMLMTHNLAKDLKYLIRLMNTRPVYLGLLGPSDRREKIISELLEYHMDINEEFLDRIYGPAGINIGAETPQEIAVSIIAEIMSVKQKEEPTSLRRKVGRIHSSSLKLENQNS